MKDEKPMKPKWWRWSLGRYNLFIATLIVSVYAIVIFQYYMGYLSTNTFIFLLFALSIYPIFYYLRYYKGLQFLDYFMLGIGIAAPISFILYLTLLRHIFYPEIAVLLLTFVLGLSLGYVIGKWRKWKPVRRMFY